MKCIWIFIALVLFCSKESSAQCTEGTLTFSRWSGLIPDRPSPVFVYTASGDEESLTGACLTRCRELGECASVAISHGKGSCQGFVKQNDYQFKLDSDSTYFQKICKKLPERCANRWWVVDNIPGYHLNSETTNMKVMENRTAEECFSDVLDSNNEVTLYRSAQWVQNDDIFEPDTIKLASDSLGSCILNQEDKFTEPESYRVANYKTFYVEDQCRHDYSKKIGRCSYEEYYNQTLKHIEATISNRTKEECKSQCEDEQRFICRGFTWSQPQGRNSSAMDRGVCDLHSEDIVTTGSWLLRKSVYASYYRRVICVNMSVECNSTDLSVQYFPRSSFRGRVYVAGRGEECGAGAGEGEVRLTLPLYGECDVHFAHAISYEGNRIVNRTMAYVLLLIQNNPIIQTAGDRWVRVYCSLDERVNSAQVDATIAVKEVGRPSIASETQSFTSPASPSAVFGETPESSINMYVIRVEQDYNDGTVSLGEPLELRIDTENESEIEAYHLVASSRLGDSSVLLIDSRGCPTGQVDFPSFTRTFINGTQRLSAKFKAFRFPTSPVVRFTLMVRRCAESCPMVECSKSSRSARKINSSEEEQAMVVGVGSACGQRAPLEVEMVVRGDKLMDDRVVKADHRSSEAEDMRFDSAVVCIHELLLVALALTWLAVQIIIILGCCVLLKRYRKLAEMSVQKDYQSFDNVGYDTTSTHRRVHWPDEHIEVIRT